MPGIYEYQCSIRKTQLSGNIDKSPVINFYTIEGCL